MSSFRPRLASALQSRCGSKLVLEPAVRTAYRYDRRRDTTPAVGDSAMRKLFGSNGSHAFGALVERAAREHPRLDVAPASGVRCWTSWNFSPHFGGLR